MIYLLRKHPVLIVPTNVLESFLEYYNHVEMICVEPPGNYEYIQSLLPVTKLYSPSTSSML